MRNKNSIRRLSRDSSKNNEKQHDAHVQRTIFTRLRTQCCANTNTFSNEVRCAADSRSEFPRGSSTPLKSLRWQFFSERSLTGGENEILLLVLSLTLKLSKVNVDDSLNWLDRRVGEGTDSLLSSSAMGHFHSFSNRSHPVSRQRRLDHFEESE